MIRSMTAFARRQTQTKSGALGWELKSVNHRYLEISPKLPEDLRAIEPDLRRLARERLGRGKLECTLRYKPSPETAAAGLSLNEPLVEQLTALHRRVGNRVGASAQAAQITDLLRWPGVVEETRPDPGPLEQAALALFAEALDELTAGREREGAALRQAIETRLDKLAEELDAVRGLLPAVRERYRERLTGRLETVSGSVDADRLEQELVLFAQKMDVDEELDRAEAHVAEIRRVLDRDEPVGRRLDFLMQELNREANTLGSKSADARMSRASVEMKVLIEQIREQVQNVE